MNDSITILRSPMGCYSQSFGTLTFQRETQSYCRSFRATTEWSERRRLVRSVLSVRRFTPEVALIIRAHLRRFDLRDTWNQLAEDRRAAVTRELFDRVHAAACGRANGTAVFDSFSNVLTVQGATR